MVDRVEPYQPNPLPMHGVLGQVELVREAATLVMLATLGMLAGRTMARTAGLHSDRLRRLGHFLLRLPADHRRLAADRCSTGTSSSCCRCRGGDRCSRPVCIAALMIVEGTLESRREGSGGSPSVERRWARLQAFGILLALYVFMADALSAVHQHGLDAASTVLPQAFNWPLFCLAFSFMAAPLMQSAWRLRPHRRWSPHRTPAGSAMPPRQRLVRPARPIAGWWR